jgi:hypothetical protein
MSCIWTQPLLAVAATRIRLDETKKRAEILSLPRLNRTWTGIGKKIYTSISEWKKKSWWKFCGIRYRYRYRYIAYFYFDVYKNKYKWEHFIRKGKKSHGDCHASGRRNGEIEKENEPHTSLIASANGPSPTGHGLPATIPGSTYKIIEPCF